MQTPYDEHTFKPFNRCAPFKPLRRFQSFKPPILSSFHARGGGSRWELNGLNDWNDLNQFSDEVANERRRIKYQSRNH